GLERHQPDGGDAEPVQVVEPAAQPLEVADAVAVGVHVGADRQAIDDGILVPEVIDHPGTAPTRMPASRRQLRQNNPPRRAVPYYAGSTASSASATTTPSCGRRSMRPCTTSSPRSAVESDRRPARVPAEKLTAVGSAPRLSATRMRSSKNSRT